MSRRRWLAGVLLAPWLAAPARALGQADGARLREAPPELVQALPGARLRGQASLRWLGWRVYDIRLWSPAPVPAAGWADAPLALELEYARALDGRRIAERSIDEMRRQGPLADAQAATWLAAMKRLFPDVAAGDRLTGLRRRDGVASFFHNSRARGELADPAFSRRFFGIWLAPQTSEPALRAALLGEAAR